MGRGGYGDGGGGRSRFEVGCVYTFVTVIPAQVVAQ